MPTEPARHPSPQDASDAKINILSGIPGKLTFGVFVFVTALAFYRICDGQPPIWAAPDALSSLKLLIIFVVFGLVAYTHSSDAEEFLPNAVIGAVAYGPMLAYILFFPKWTIFALWLCIFAGIVLLKTLPSRGWFANVLHILAILWGISSILTLALHLGWIPHLDELLKQVGINASSLAGYLRFRILLAGLFAFALLFASFRRAFSDNSPTVPRIPSAPRCTPDEAPSGLLAPILRPLLIAFDALVSAIVAIGDLFWLIGAYIGIYLWRIGKGMLKYLSDLFLRKPLWQELLRLLGLYGLVGLFCFDLSLFLSPLQQYLRTPSSLFHVYPSIFAHLGAVALYAVFLPLLGISAHAVLLDGLGNFTKSALPREAFASAMVAVAVCCASWLLYLVVKLHLVQIPGFETIGPLTTVTAGFTVLVSFLHLMKKPSARISSTQPASFPADSSRKAMRSRFLLGILVLGGVVAIYVAPKLIRSIEVLSWQRQQQQKLNDESAAAKQRQEEQKNSAREGMQRAEAARREEQERAERATQERTAQEHAAQERVAQEHAAQERVAQERAAQEREQRRFHLTFHNQTGTNLDLVLDLIVSDVRNLQKRPVGPGQTATFDFAERPKALSYRADVRGGEAFFWSDTVDTASSTNQRTANLVLSKDRFVLKIWNRTGQRITSVDVGGRQFVTDLAPNDKVPYVVGAFTIPTNPSLRLSSNSMYWLYRSLEFQTDQQDGFKYVEVVAK